MSTKSRSYAQQIHSAHLMATALLANLEILKKRGMTEEFIAELNATLDSVIDKNSEQERLKAELKMATFDLETLMTKLHAKMKEALKVVKLEVQQQQWKEYGIDHKR